MRLIASITLSNRESFAFYRVGFAFDRKNMRFLVKNYAFMYNYNVFIYFNNVFTSNPFAFIAKFTSFAKEYYNLQK